MTERRIARRYELSLPVVVRSPIERQLDPHNGQTRDISTRVVVIFAVSLVALLGGGVLGALLFYLITNTASWFFNPFQNAEYTKDLLGWITALTKGTAGWPSTWEFFIRSLMSGGLFTGLFVGAMKLTASTESAREKGVEEEKPEEAEPEQAPEEGKA